MELNNQSTGNLCLVRSSNNVGVAVQFRKKFGALQWGRAGICYEKLYGVGD